MTEARILVINGDRDAIRFGRVAWEDGFSLSFHYDRLSGAVRLISCSAVEKPTDVTADYPARLPALVAALHLHPQAGPPLTARRRP